MKMLCVKDFEDYAKEHLPLKTWNFFSNGAERDDTLNDNENAFRRYKFLPRMLRTKDNIDLGTTVLGEKINFPIGIAPAAYHKMVHHLGEIATAKAAEGMKTVLTLSTVSNTSFKEVANVCPNTLKWMQVYILKEHERTAKMVRQLEKCGYKALVVTVDFPVAGLRLKSKKVGFDLPPHLGIPNVYDGETRTNGARTFEQWNEEIQYAVTWEDILWLKSICNLPLVLKGIMTVEDAKLAVKYGASAVWVSNHGGRQLDGALATIDALGPIVQALEGSGCEVYVDGGIRWGSDVLKALALGAKAVFIGRPYLWGLTHSGEEGVRKILEILKNELIVAMKLTGCRSLSDASSSILYKTPASML